MLLRLVRATPNIDHHVLSLSGRGELSDALAASGARVFGQSSGLRRFSAAFLEARPDVIQGWMYHGNLAALALWFRFPTARLFWSIRQSIAVPALTKRSTRKILALQARLSNLPRAVIYNSEEAATGHEALGFSRARRCMIANGFDVDEFRPDLARRAHMRAELGLGETDLAIGLIARFDPWKNHAGFFRVASAILAEHPRCVFILAGKGVEWTNEELVALIPEGQLRRRVLLLGDRRDISTIAASLDIGCNVSHGEGFPNAVGEVMACGVPCVVTPVGASAHLVGDSGFIARSTDDSDIRKALEAAVIMEGGARSVLGQGARERIKAHFSIGAVADRFIAVYDGTAAGSPNAGNVM